MQNKILIVSCTLCLSIGILFGFIVNNKSSIIDGLNKELEEINGSLDDTKEELDNTNDDITDIEYSEKLRVKQEKYIDELRLKNSKLLSDLIESEDAIINLINENNILKSDIEEAILQLELKISAEMDAARKLELEKDLEKKLEEQILILKESLRLEKEQIIILKDRAEKDEIMLFVEKNPAFEYIYDFEEKKLVLVGLKDDAKLDESIVIGQDIIIDLGDELVTYHNDTKTIPSEMFKGKLSGVKNLEIAEGIELIDADAFSNNNIESLILPESLIVVSNNAFSENSLKSIKFGSNLETLGKSSFARNDLVEIKLPESLKVIEEEAFIFNKIIEITIPKSVTKVAKYSFTRNAITTMIIESGSFAGFHDQAIGDVGSNDDKRVTYYNKELEIMSK